MTLEVVLWVDPARPPWRLMGPEIPIACQLLGPSRIHLGLQEASKQIGDGKETVGGLGLESGTPFSSVAEKPLAERGVS